MNKHDIIKEKKKEIEIELKQMYVDWEKVRKLAHYIELLIKRENNE